MGDCLTAYKSRTNQFYLISLAMICSVYKVRHIQYEASSDFLIPLRAQNSVPLLCYNLPDISNFTLPHMLRISVQIYSYLVCQGWEETLCKVLHAGNEMCHVKFDQINPWTHLQLNEFNII